MPQHVESWSIPGSDDQPIIGDMHYLGGDPRGVLVIAHGFKGYKDYGMFPRIAAQCAHAGYIAHRFNFSHAGMTNNIDTFERPDLFEKDTWNKQVADLRTVIRHAAAASLRDPERTDRRDLPVFILGHSRGGVTAILTLGRYANDPSFPQIAGLITLAAPSTACSLSSEDQQRLLRDGYLDSPSSRTGQNLRIGRDFLQEQLDDPDHHDVLAMAARIRCPMLIIHGEDDPTVPARAAHEIAGAASANAKSIIIPRADHVFNTPNPFPPHPPPEAGPALAALISALLQFAQPPPAAGELQ